VIAPTAQQLRILRLMAAGAKLTVPATRANDELRVNDVLVGIVRHKTTEVMYQSGWIGFSPTKEHWVLTDAGRSHAEVHAFVRAFSEAPR
jgi:hypothetical protein